VIITNAHEELTQWVELGIYGFTNGYDGESKAIGHAIDGKLVAATTFSRFQARQDGSFHSCELGIFSIDKRWATRQYLRAVFEYTFAQLKLERVHTVCSANEGDIMKFNQKLGFTQEGVHRKGWITGCDSVSWGMLKSECKWL
jgi:RimJ/RimL family protein N-acetyltransferase